MQLSSTVLILGCFLHLFGTLDSAIINTCTKRIVVTDYARRSTGGGRWTWRWTKYKTVAIYKTKIVCCDDYGPLPWSPTTCYPRCNGTLAIYTPCNLSNEGYVILQNGTVLQNSGGVCVKPDECDECNDGYYAHPNGVCKACLALPNCDIPSCTNGSESACIRCNGNKGSDAEAFILENGRCIKACSWRSNSRCFPGSCTPSERPYSTCNCDEGFSGPDCSEMNAKAEIGYHLLDMYLPNERSGSLVSFPKDTAAYPQPKDWSKRKEVKEISLEVQTHLSLNISSKPYYIKNYRFGVLQTEVILTLIRDNDTDIRPLKYSETYGLPNTAKTFKRDVYLTNGDWGEYFEFRHGDEIRFEISTESRFEMENFDYDRSDTTKYTMNGTVERKTFALGFDLMEPVHCVQGQTPCQIQTLTVADVTREPTIAVEWDGWTDELSGIAKYELEVGRMIKKNSTNDIGTDTQRFTRNSSESSFTVTFGTPGLYAVYIHVFDKADNFNSARKLTIFDDNSTVKQFEPVPHVETASAETGHQWITRPTSEITIIYKGRFKNIKHEELFVLGPVEHDDHLTWSLEDNDGVRTLEGIKNNEGIVRYEVGYRLLEGSTVMKSVDFTRVPDSYFDTQTMVVRETVYDGLMIKFDIRGYDVLDVFAEDTINTTVDLSPPIIPYLWLTDGEYTNISVHSDKDLTKLTIEWELYDFHSGIESLSWRIFDNFTGTDLQHGMAIETPQGETTSLEHCNATYGGKPRGPNCYCTPYSGCYHRHFQVKPKISTGNISESTGLHLNGTHGVHERDYFIHLTAVNNALLSASKTLKITVDVSPPIPGTVLDGIIGEPEVDFQQSRTLHAYWYDFFDKESGIKFYRYAFSTECLPVQAFELNSPDKNMLTETSTLSASYTVSTEGTYFITVAAYNHALDPSVPVCSDGVTVDTSPPIISEVAVEGAAVKPQVLEDSNGHVFYLRPDRTIVQIFGSPKECKEKTSAMAADDLSAYPNLRSPNGTKRVMGTSEAIEVCTSVVNHGSQVIAYLQETAHLQVSWNVTEGPSGVHDYFIGLATTASSVPDREAWATTHHHQHTRLLYPNIEESEPFYILIKAISKSTTSSIKIVGPFVADTTHPDFLGTISVVLDHPARRINISWLEESFVDREDTTPLHFQIAVGTDNAPTSVLPFSDLSIGKTCEVASGTCISIPYAKLHWNLHGRQAYTVSVKAANTRGLFTIGSSEAFLYDVDIPSVGVVYDLRDEDHSEFQENVDIDFQTEVSRLAIGWSGFRHLYQDITYHLCVADSPIVETFITCEQGNESSLSHTFEGLSLQFWKTYYQVVIAQTLNGNVSAVSDGVTIIDKSSLPQGILVFDGLPCNETTSTEAFYFTHHSEDKRLRCQTDMDYQASTSQLTVNWLIPDAAGVFISDINWAVEEKSPIADHWETFRNFERVTVSNVFSKHDLVLQPGRKYRSLLKMCVEGICFDERLTTNGVFVVPNPPVTGFFGVEYDNTTRQVSVTMARFQDADIQETDEAFLVLDHYEWAITDNSHDGRTMTIWERLQNISQLNETHISFTKQLDIAHDFTKCFRLAVRGRTKAGLSSIVSSEILDCNDRYKVAPSAVIDAIGKPLPVPDDEMIRLEGQPIVLEENAHWESIDQDYTPFNNIISAVWPILRYKNYTWSVLENVNEDIFVGQSVTLRDPCSHPDAIRCGKTENEYVNVLFQNYRLTHGRRYRVCIHANATTLHHEEWSQDMPEIGSCSDGITVDITPPEAGRVWIGHLPSIRYQTSTSDLSINWESFQDVEEEGRAIHSSGIAHYMVALGTSHGGVDILDYVNVGLTNHATLHGLSLQSGHTYFASVRGFDFVNNSATATSREVKVDTTPPETTLNQITIGNRYLTEINHVSACWEGVFIDKESGITSYQWAIGSKQGLIDILPLTEVTSECSETGEDDGLLLKEGHIYFISVKAFNNVGLFTTASSWGFRVETSPPVAGHVYEGSRQQNGSYVDVDFFSKKSDIEFYWEGFHDPQSGVQQYYFCLGTDPEGQDLMTLQPVGLVGEISLPYLNLAEGVRYFATVTACNTADLCQSSSSDGFLLDRSPPTPGRVFDGVETSDIQYQSSRNFIGAKWFGFSDPQSDIAKYVWRAGSAPGGDDIVPATNVHLSEFATELDLQQRRGYQLPVNTKIYTTVRAYNKAGTYSEASSNGFIVDITAPGYSMPLTHVPIGSMFPGTSIYRTLLRIEWKVEDPESAIDEQYVSLSSHIGGDFNLSSVLIEGVARDYTLTGLDLHDGSYYDITLISCNGAKLCNMSRLENILVDSTKPTPGVFACDTDHALDLGRQPDGWMRWKTASIMLSWIGFSDVHSGILHYVINVGSTYMTSDLNKASGEPFIVAHNDSGQHHAEGPIQMAEIPTKLLTFKETVFISIHALNKVGLSSEVIHSEFKLRDGWTMELVRRCSAATCYGHCVCSPHGQTCSPQGRTCRNVTGDTTYAQLAVVDYQNLASSDEAREETHIPQATLLAARWSIINPNGIVPLWYEWSVGETIYASPSGVFDQTEERVWHDAGQNMSWVYTAPLGFSLNALRVKYSFFVRAWYDENTYAVFKSPGVTTYPNPPKSINIRGASVKETVVVGGKDVDFLPTDSVLMAEWTDKFLNTADSLLKYHLYISTRPGGHDVHVAARDISKDTTYFNLTSLPFQPGITYYTVVQAFNYAGLHSTETSDGFTIDNDPPHPGIVLDGEVLHDRYAQSTVDCVPSFWHSFSDTCSGIKTYGWCLSSLELQGPCDITSLRFLGLATSENITLERYISSGTVVYNKVLAVDVAGYFSKVVSSNGIIIDDTPPLRESKLKFLDNVLQNPSFEADGSDVDLSNTASLKTCKGMEIKSWNATEGSCAFSVCHMESNVGHGRCFLVVKGSVQQVVQNIQVGERYRLTINAAHLPFETSTLSSNEGLVSFENIQHVFILYNKPHRSDMATTNSSDLGMLSWHQHTFYFTQVSNISILEIGSASHSSGILLDNIRLEKGKLEYNGVTEQKGHVAAHTVYVHDWSSVHASWRFVDPESGIREYFWAIGTVEGGTQLQNFVSVGLSTFAQTSSLRLVHNSVVHVTVMAVNEAGLRTISYSDPIFVDLTPPAINDLRDGVTSVADVDFQSSSTISATWEVVDLESGITDCAWAIGVLGDLTLLQDFVSVGGDIRQASVPLARNQVEGRTVFVTVKCTNGAGQYSTLTSDGVTVMDNAPSADSVVVQVLGQTLTEYPVKDRYHGDPSSIRFRWSGFEDDEGIDSYIISLEGNGVSQSELLPGDADGYTYASFRNLDLPDGDYTVSVTGINMLKMYSEKTSTNFTLLTQQPFMTGNEIDVRKIVNTADIRVSWADVFHSPHPVYYEVSVGRFPGNADVIQWQETLQTALVFQAPKDESQLNVFVSVRCISFSGVYVTRVVEQLLD